MNAHFMLPIAALAVLTLTACESASDSPDIPNPDAGTPPSESEATTDDSDVDMEPTQDIDQRVEDIQREATETFDSILSQSGEAGSEVVNASENAMDSLSGQMDSMENALDQQIAQIVQSVEELNNETMTSTDKADAIANARNAAQQAARSLGRSEAEIAEAGDRAEQAAAEVLDYQL